MSRDIFHSEPAQGAVEVDATGADVVLVLDMQTDIGNKYHFEICNRDQVFTPTDEIRLSTWVDKESLSKNIMQIRIPRALR